MYNMFKRRKRYSFDGKHLCNKRNGFTITEAAMAVAVIVIAALGTLCYEYLCIDHVRIARAQLAATRVGQLLIEDWKSTGGGEYSPEDLNMGFVLPPDAEAGEFMTTIDGMRFFITMDSSEAEPPDTFSGTILRELDVTIQWKHDFSNGTPTDSDPAVVLSTYVRPDL
jgi:hypothetical protein